MTLPSLHSFFQALSSGILLGGLYALSALGLSLVLGVMRLVNLVHGEVVVFGAYLAYVLLKYFGLDPLLSLPVVFLLAFILTGPLHRALLAPVTKYGEEAPLLTTFAIGIIAQNLFIKIFSGDSRSLDRPYTRTALHALGITIPVIYLIGFVISLVISVAVYLLMSRTGFGRELRASTEDAEAASIVGVHVARIHSVTFALSGGLAAVGGVLIALCFSFTPSSGSDFLLTGFVIVVLGGLGSVFGTFLGGVTLGVLQSFVALIFGDGYRTLIGLVVFLIILATKSEGLFNKRKVQR